MQSPWSLGPMRVMDEPPTGWGIERADNHLQKHKLPDENVQTFLQHHLLAAFLDIGR